MTMKDKLKSYSFWMSVAGGVVLVLNNLGVAFGFAIESETVIQIVDSVCGVLILFGIITMPKTEANENESNLSFEQNDNEIVDNQHEEQKDIKNDDICLLTQKVKQAKNCIAKKNEADKEQGE